MAEPETKDDKLEESFRSFRVDITLVLVGLFLALGVQNIIQYFEAVYPRISPYFYLGIGVGSLVLVLAFLGMAARIAGVDEVGKRRHAARRSLSKQ